MDQERGLRYSRVIRAESAFTIRVILLVFIALSFLYWVF